MGVVAVVTARGGSVGFPGKNLALFLGRPLVAVAVGTGVAAGADQVLLSTDDDAIAAAAGADATLVRRPAELAGPASKSVDAVLHAVDHAALPDDTVVVLLQPTSPLRTAADVRECVALHGNRRTGSVVQFTESTQHHPWKSCVVADGTVAPVRDWADLEAPRQTLPTVLRPTGGVYVVTAGELRREQRFFLPDVLAQIVPEARAVDVDSPADLADAERAATEWGWTAP